MKSNSTKSNSGSIRLGYVQGCLVLPAGEDAEVVLPEELPPAGPGEIERSLDQSFGKSLDEFQGSKSASILVSDITRPAPSHLMLPPLIKRMRELDIKNTKIVFALGTHRRMTTDEEAYLLKDCLSLPNEEHDPRACVSLGQTRRGTPVEILESVASSDLIVATGNI